MQTDKINVQNLTELEGFGEELKNASIILEGMFDQLNTQMQQTYSNWNDAVGNAFMEQFEESHKQINEISVRLLNFSKYIKDECEALIIYIEQSQHINR